jgi:hypothetical protein
VRNDVYPISVDVGRFRLSIVSEAVVLRDQHISVGGWGERTINTQTPKLRRPSFFLNYPPLSLLLAFSEITETDPTILIRQPSLLT